MHPDETPVAVCLLCAALMEDNGYRLLPDGAAEKTEDCRMCRRVRLCRRYEVRRD